MSPEQAAKMMRLMGTVEGERLSPKIPWMKANPDGKPTFQLKDRLDSYILRQYCSKSISYIQDKLNKAAASPNLICEVDEDEDD